MRMKRFTRKRDAKSCDAQTYNRMLCGVMRKKVCKNMQTKMLRDVAINVEMNAHVMPWVGLRKMKKAGNKTEQKNATADTK